MITGNAALWVGERDADGNMVDGKIFHLRPGTVIRVERNEPHRMLTTYQGGSYFAVQVPSMRDKEEQEPPDGLVALMEKHRIPNAPFKGKA